MLKHFISLFLGLMEINALASTSFSADYQSALWDVKKSLLECHLSHHIPGYGDLKFYQLAGFSEKAELKVLYNRAPDWAEGKLNFAASDWDNQSISTPGWKFDFARAGNTVEFNHVKSRRILNALVKGKVPVISHTDYSDSSDIIEAKVSSVNFVPAYKDYMACLRDLVPVKFTELSTSNIYFTTASAKIDARSQEWLDYVAAYAKELNVRRIDLGGHADSVGTFRANHRLSTARVRNVKSYLISKGVPKNKILARVFGEHRADADNRTPKGRALNRKVTIKILP